MSTGVFRRYYRPPPPRHHPALGVFTYVIPDVTAVLEGATFALVGGGLTFSLTYPLSGSVYEYEGGDLAYSIEQFHWPEADPVESSWVEASGLSASWAEEAPPVNTWVEEDSV